MTVKIHKVYDPEVQVPDEFAEVPGRTVRGSRKAIEEYVRIDVEWAEGLCFEVGCRVVCNTNVDRTVYFIIWFLDTGMQVDTFTVTEENTQGDTPAVGEES